MPLSVPLHECSSPACRIHTFASWISLVPTKIWFDSYWAHTAILCGILLWATWNGANFYFRVSRWCLVSFYLCAIVIVPSYGERSSFDGLRLGWS